jgi:hypothetical protein
MWRCSLTAAAYLHTPSVPAQACMCKVGTLKSQEIFPRIYRKRRSVLLQRVDRPREHRQPASPRPLLQYPGPGECEGAHATAAWCFEYMHALRWVCIPTAYVMAIWMQLAREHVQKRLRPLALAWCMHLDAGVRQARLNLAACNSHEHASGFRCRLQAEQHVMSDSQSHACQLYCRKTGAVLPSYFCMCEHAQRQELRFA